MTCRSPSPWGLYICGTRPFPAPIPRVAPSHERESQATQAGVRPSSFLLSQSHYEYPSPLRLGACSAPLGLPLAELGSTFDLVCCFCLVLFVVPRACCWFPSPLPDPFLFLYHCAAKSHSWCGEGRHTCLSPGSDTALRILTHREAHVFGRCQRCVTWNLPTAATEMLEPREMELRQSLRTQSRQVVNQQSTTIPLVCIKHPWRDRGPPAASSPAISPGKALVSNSSLPSLSVVDCMLSSHRAICGPASARFIRPLPRMTAKETCKQRSNLSYPQSPVNGRRQYGGEGGWLMESS